jgi:cytidine deaminase
MDIKREVNISHVKAENLTKSVVSLIQHAQNAAGNAYAPYSTFKVGAALELDNGIVIEGNNQENAAFPSGICAERVAVFAAKANHPNAAINQIVIAVKTDLPLKQGFTPPCGSCLQVLWDIQNRQNSPLQIHVLAEDGSVYTGQDVNQFLPFGFKL